jgi:outer membrane lipoprotein-sorting protein
MSCLSQRQLARLAFGLAEDAELTVHLEQCAACRSSLETMQSLRHELAEVHAKLDEGHEEARERLLRLLQAANQPPEPARPWMQVSHWISGLTVRQRIAAFGSIGVAAVLGFLLVCGGIDPTLASAMEKMAENIRKAKSFKATAVLEIKPASKNTTQPHQGRGALYWLSTGSNRWDLKGNLPGSGEQDQTNIRIAGKSWIMIIDHKAKRVHKVEMPQETSDNLDVVQRLGGFSGRADRDLGVKEINGKKARGFEISMTKILSPSNAALVQAKDMVEVWIDAESSLPVLVQFNYITGLKKEKADTLFFRLQDFQWNIDLNRKLFDTAIPKGYTDVTSCDALPSQPRPAEGRVQREYPEG